MEHRVYEVLAHVRRPEVDERKVPIRHADRSVRILLERIREHVSYDVVRTAMQVDEIHVHLHAERMGAVVEGLEILVASVLGVDLVVVRYAVWILRGVESARLLALAPTRLVHVAVHLHKRSEVHHVHADGPDVVEHLSRGLEVSVPREVAKDDLIDRGVLEIFGRRTHRA